jgi:hypothetical protein
MKKMIILGSCLVAGAVVYGVTDYLRTDKIQLRHMYSDETEATAPAAKKTVAPAIAAQAADTGTAIKTLLDTLLMTAPPPRPLSLDLYSRSSLSEKYIEPDSISIQEKRPHRKRKHR